MTEPIAKPAMIEVELTARRPRRRDLDRLRVLACLSTFFYHAIQIFDLNPYYHIKSLTLSPSIKTTGPTRARFFVFSRSRP